MGRSGDLGQGLDPTVFVQTSNAPQLRRELIGYKQIGLTDYLFYISNKDKRAQESFIGIPAQGASSPGAPAVKSSYGAGHATSRYPGGPLLSGFDTRRE